MEQNMGQEASPDPSGKSNNALKRFFENRLMEISKDFSQLLQKIPNDLIINQMKGDSASASHIEERIVEMVQETLQNAQEKTIDNLSKDIHAKETDMKSQNQKTDDILKEFKKCDKERKLYKVKLAEKKQKITELEDQIKDKTRELANSATNAEKQKSEIEALTIQEADFDKLKRINDENDEKISELQSIIESLQLYRVEAEKAKIETERMKEEAEKVKEKHDKISQEKDVYEEALQKTKKNKKALQEDIETLTKMLKESEKDRMRLKKLHMSVSERLFSALTLTPNASFYQKFQSVFDVLFGKDGMFLESASKLSASVTGSTGSPLQKSSPAKQQDSEMEQLYFFRHKLKDLRGKLYQELKEQKNNEKLQKKKIIELSSALELKSHDLEEANALIVKCKAKIDNLKEISANAIAEKEKTEKTMKRNAVELEESLERETKAHVTLQHEFGKRVQEEKQLTEKRVREELEGQVSSLKSEIANRDQLLQKTNFQHLMNNQLNEQAKNQMKPDKLERMLEVYESKIATYQRDYLSKTEHHERVKGLEKKFKAERENIEKQLDMDLQNKLRDMEDKKNKEFNNTLSNIKDAVKSVEDNLTNEKENNKQLWERIENEQSVISSLKSQIKDSEDIRKQLMGHLEETNQRADKLNNLLESETKMREKLQKIQEELNSETKRLTKMVSDLKTHSETQAKTIQTNKQEISGLKSAIEENKNEIEEKDSQIQKQRSSIETLERERIQILDQLEHFLQEIKSMIEANNMNFSPNPNTNSVLSKSFAFSQTKSNKNKKNFQENSTSIVLCNEIKDSISELKYAFDSTTSQLTDKIKEKEKQISTMKFNFTTQMHTINIQLKEQINSLKSEITLLKTNSEKEFVQTSHFFEKQLDAVLTNLKDHGSNVSSVFTTLQQSYINENSSLKKKFDERIEQQENEFRNETLKLQFDLNSNKQKLDTLNEEIAKKKSQIDNLEEHVSDFKKAMNIIGGYITLPTIVHSTILNENNYKAKFNPNNSSKDNSQRMMIEKQSISQEWMDSLRKVFENFSVEMKKREEFLKIKEEQVSTLQKQIELFEKQTNELRNALEKSKDRKKEIAKTAKETADFYEQQLQVTKNQLETFENNLKKSIQKR